MKFPPIPYSPSAAFSAVLIAAIVGFGLFFDHLAEAQPVPAPAVTEKQ